MRRALHDALTVARGRVAFGGASRTCRWRGASFSR